MSNFDEILIASARAKISLWKATLSRIENDHVMRNAYESAIQAEEKYVSYLESRRPVNTLNKD
jgi:hypothetical protein